MSKNNKKGFEIPNDVRLFTGLTLKKYMKKYADEYSSKKKQKKGYYDMLICQLPEVIKLMVNYSHIKEVQEIRNEVYDRLFDKKLIKKITKLCEEDMEQIDYIELLPIIIYDVLKEAHKQHMKEKAEDENAKMFDVSDLVKLSNIILKKKMKKLSKSGVNKELAFDVLSTVPTSSILDKGAFRLKNLMAVLYVHAKTETISKEEFAAVVKHVVTPKNYPGFITYLLLERKSDYVTLDDKQKEFYHVVTDWAFKTLEEEFDEREIEQILKAYFGARKRDKAQNKDANRRFFLSSLPGDEKNGYPKTVKVLNKLQSNDESIKEFV